MMLVSIRYLYACMIDAEIDLYRFWDGLCNILGFLLWFFCVCVDGH